MSTKLKFTMLWLMLLGYLTAACAQPPKFVAPEIDPPTDLIPSYVPEGFELVSGFQLTGDVPWPVASEADEALFVERLGKRLIFANLKSPSGNEIQGVYYQGKEHLLLITKSYFPEGTLDLWRTTYEAPWPKPCECECFKLRLEAVSLSPRIAQIQEERIIDGTQVAILKGPMGWTTVFVRGEYLLTVESGLSLAENLKVVTSLLDS
ncbi:MAG TPA: hypothetical protein VLA49_04980 [Anaerolineales bacterium]|nr:hypothetical protein [Anaerolineales bacterium]